MTIGIAILGAGIFAREAHLPAIESCPKLSLKAIYSRSQTSSEALTAAATSATGITTYFESPSLPNRSLADLLAREDIQAVAIALPVVEQPRFIKAAIEAGKHVISEKPIAPDVKTAQDLIAWYSSAPRTSIWNVAENFRFIDPLVLGSKAVKELGGEITTFSVEVFSCIDDQDKFYQTEWRKVPAYQGGFLLDGGVHLTAGLRYLLQAAGEKITHLSAFTTLLQPKLPPLDTVNATIRITNGRSGTFRASYGMVHKSGFELEVVTSTGSVSVKPTDVTVITKDQTGEKIEKKTEFPFGLGVQAEMEAFVEQIETKRDDSRLSPSEALADLQLLQSLLESGERDGAVVDLRSS